MAASSDDLQGSIQELSGKVDHLSQTVFDIGGKHEAFMIDSLNERVRQNDRLTALEANSLSVAGVKGAVAEALTEHGVVTQSTLGTVVYRQFLGGTKRAAIYFSVMSAGIGGMVVLLQHIVSWIR